MTRIGAVFVLLVTSLLVGSVAGSDPAVAVAAGCARVDPTQVDEIAVPLVMDAATGVALAEVGEPVEPQAAKQQDVHPGANVALLVDRSRIFHVDPDTEVGESGALGEWTCEQQGALRCSGTLIASEWVLTAAHCVSTLSGTSPEGGGPEHRDLQLFHLVARTGSVDAHAGGNLTTVVETHVHPGWSTGVRADGTWGANHADMRNDLVLLRLAEPVDVAPVVLRRPPREPERYELVASGWGVTPDGPTQRLHVWTNQVAPPEACIEGDVAGSFDEATMLCTDEHDGSGTCLGDSGGPLGVAARDGRFHVFAITSFVLFGDGSYTCDQPRRASFTLLTPAHHDWITDVVGELPSRDGAG